ncbi:hypothetical protein ACPDHQ_09175 [Myroides odoratimimus]|uniref:hypothetical protein n=1 Tax=Myroides odoratimimus TaxID=76832 RepID=UPI0025761A45|nr:hypothetical protein [Myroides odoratimimus]MDM1093900.1 hypothetical protein [Myroides odoratimimus]
MKTLTTDQIQALHTFVKKHYVEYYDIELELVDHLANGIESQWKEDGSLPFETALDREFKKFGVFGFSDVVDSKIIMTTNSYLKQMYKVLLSFFTIPKIIVSLAIFLLSFAIGLALPNYYLEIFIITSFILLLGFIGMGIRWQIELKQINKKSNKKWYLTRVATMALGGPVILVIAPSFNSINLLQNYISSISFLILTSFLITLLILWVYISLFVFIPFMRKEIHHSIQRHQLT